MNYQMIYFPFTSIIQCCCFSKNVLKFQTTNLHHLKMTKQKKTKEVKNDPFPLLTTTLPPSTQQPTPWSE